MTKRRVWWAEIDEGKWRDLHSGTNIVGGVRL